MKWSLCLSGMLVWLCTTASAQGLVWSLPQEGQWVRYEGTYTQVERRPDSNEGDLPMEWRRIVTLKCLGSEEVEFRGKNVPGRWVEIKIETGRAKEGVLEAGPGGVQLYKLLIPEVAIHGKAFEPVIDEREVFVSHVPVVKGFRKSGDTAAVEISSKVFQLYPVVSLLNHYPDLQSEGAAQEVTVQAGSFSSTLEKGRLVTESPISRATNTCELYRSAAIPFGVVKWTAQTVTEVKASTDLRDAFKESITISEDMQAVATGEGAQSELAQ